MLANVDNKKGCPLGKGTPVRENAECKHGNGGASLENAADECPSNYLCRVALFRILWLTPTGFCRKHAVRRKLGDVIDEMQEEIF